MAIKRMKYIFRESCKEMVKLYMHIQFLLAEK